MENTSFRNLVFRMLSRQAAMIHLLLVWCHEAYPFPPFLILLDHSLKERILAEVVVCTSRFDNDKNTLWFAIGENQYGGSSP